MTKIRHASTIQPYAFFLVTIPVPPLVDSNTVNHGYVAFELQTMNLVMASIYEFVDVFMK